VNDGDATLERRLKRMQWLATGLVALMALLFVATSLWRDAWPWLGAPRAFAEAALIGGLADWFAVTALFRRPLGLPIPHTAIVPNRKDVIGRSLARFVADHFLVRTALEQSLGRLKLAANLGRWLQRPDNAASASRDVGRALQWLLAAGDTGPLRGALATSFGELTRTIPIRRLLGALIEVLATGPYADQLISALLGFGREQLDRNKPLIRSRIHDRSPWWLPKFVDAEIYDQLVAELERILAQIDDEGSHPARMAIRARLGQLADSVADDPDFMNRTEALRTEFLQHPAVADFGRDALRHLQDHFVAALDDPGSELRRGLTRELQNLGTKLATDAATAAELDAWLGSVAIYLVERYREPISSIIPTTVAQWDSQATSRRIELHIGRDLQFIRINGTLVGGLVGLLLWLSWTAGFA
jgi:uncharacterized membrane-anchored protein YjiN (DUF445 family)